MFVEIKSPKHTETKTVSYLGGEATIPAHHDWMAVIMLGKASYNTCVLASFANKPLVSESGLQWVPADEDFAIAGQVGKLTEDQLIHTLRQVDQVRDNKQVLLQNTEELVIKIKHILSLEGSTEGKLHAIYCPEHGVFTDFMEHCSDIFEAMYGDEDESDHDAESKIRAELEQAISQLFAEVPERKVQPKPRIRVIRAKSLEEALAEINKDIDGVGQA